MVVDKLRHYLPKYEISEDAYGFIRIGNEKHNIVFTPRYIRNTSVKNLVILSKKVLR